jgi:hypothetical protein
MRKHLRLVALIIPMVLVASNSYAAVKAGSSCSKAGIKGVSAGKTYTCVKSGKKLVWDKGVVVPVAKPSPAPSASASTAPVAKSEVVKVTEGDSCPKMGVQNKDSGALLECRRVAGNKLVYVAITNNFSPVINPASPDPLSTCQLPDMRANKLWIRPGIAYPPTPFPGFSATGTFKVVVVGFDFSDAVGSGSPSTYWNSDIKNASEWISWYSNDKVKYNFVTVDKWLRAPRPATAYENQNESSKAAGSNTLSEGGVTDAEKTASFLKLIEAETDISNTTAIWIYHPPTVVGKLTGQWYDRDVKYESSKYGKVTASLFAIGGDTWYSMRTRWGYLMHEMLHSHGIFGHSPKIPWRIGILSTGDSWSTALLSWDSLATGWTNPEDLYCVEKSKVTSTDIKLVPLEREQKGNRVAMIKLSKNQLLMVESHRRDKWSEGLAPGFTGVMVTLVDTTKNTTWDNPEGFANPSSVGVALKIPGVNHGPYESWGEPHPNPGNEYRGVGVINGIGVSGDKEGWDQNYFMYQGESITYEGIKISLIGTGDNDTVRIEKAS